MKLSIYIPCYNDGQFLLRTLNSIPVRDDISFVRNQKGRAEASQGTHDDLVMALAIGYHALTQLPSRPKKIIKPERRDEDLEFFNYQ